MKAFEDAGDHWNLQDATPLMSLRQVGSLNSAGRVAVPCGICWGHGRVCVLSDASGPDVSVQRNTGNRWPCSGAASEVALGNSLNFPGFRN